MGSPPLRFRESAPPADLVASPPAAAPPLPHLTQAESSVGQANTAAAHALSSDRPADASGPESKADAQKSTPVSILPDTIRPQVQAEDFLPYFLIPDSAKTDNQPSRPPQPPSPGTLPPSTATYTQTPK